MKIIIAVAFVSIIGVGCYSALCSSGDAQEKTQSVQQQVAWSGQAAITITGEQLKDVEEAYYLSAKNDDDMKKAHGLPTALFIEKAQKLNVTNKQVFVRIELSGMQEGGKGHSLQSFGGVLAIVNRTKDIRFRINLQDFDIIKSRTIHLPNKPDAGDGK